MPVVLVALGWIFRAELVLFAVGKKRSAKPIRLRLGILPVSMEW